MTTGIAVLGAGALGLYFGGRLAHAGEPVAWVARSDSARLRNHGLRLETPTGELILPAPLRAAATAAELGPAALVIVALKATANAHLPALLAPLLGPDTLVLNLQNGLGVDAAVAAVAGPERTLGGLCFMCVNRLAPGYAACTSAGYMALGELVGPPQDRTEALAARLRAAGIKTLLSPSLAEARWRKLVWNIPFNGLAVAAGGVTTEQVLASPELTEEVWRLMREVQAIAAAHGVTIPETFLEQQVRQTQGMGPYRPSTLVDFLAGRPLEVETIWGEPLRRAQACGVPTPRLATLYARLAAVA